jgi:hypothetical protein
MRKFKKVLVTLCIILGVSVSTLNASQIACDKSMDYLIEAMEERMYVLGNVYSSKLELEVAKANVVSQYDMARKYCRNSPEELSRLISVDDFVRSLR